MADYVERHLRGSAVRDGARLAQMVDLVPAGAASLLDVGAGHGLLLEALQARRGIVGVGIEITEAKVAYARSRGIDLRLGDASQLAFAAASFDVVLCCELLEHLPCGVYEATLGELARVARDAVIVSVPFDERRHFVGCPYCGASVNPNYHFRSFDAGKMADLLPGFALERTMGLGREPHGVLKAWLRPWLSRQWPALLVFPSCGWRLPSPPVASVVAAGPGAPANNTSWLRRLAAALATPGRPLWRVAVYRRAGVASWRGR